MDKKQQLYSVFLGLHLRKISIQRQILSETAKAKLIICI